MDEQHVLRCVHMPSQDRLGGHFGNEIGWNFAAKKGIDWRKLDRAIGEHFGTDFNLQLVRKNARNNAAKNPRGLKRLHRSQALQ